MEGVLLKLHLSTEENRQLNSQTCETQRQSWRRCRRPLSRHLAMRMYSCMMSMESGWQCIYTTWCYFCVYPLQLIQMLPFIWEQIPSCHHTVPPTRCLHEWSHICLVMVALCLLAARPRAIPHPWYHRHAPCPMISAARRYKNTPLCILCHLH